MRILASRDGCLQPSLRLINTGIDSLIWWKISRFSELSVQPGGWLPAGDEARLLARVTSHHREPDFLGEGQNSERF